MGASAASAQLGRSRLRQQDFEATLVGVPKGRGGTPDGTPSPVRVREKKRRELAYKYESGQSRGEASPAPLVHASESVSPAWTDRYSATACLSSGQPRPARTMV
jgi:hypothetical protein